MIARVADQRVWNSIRWLYTGAGLLFLANIALGVLNVFTDGDLPRAQLLAHLHSGTIGWITLSVIATMFWVFTGDRVVSDKYASFVRTYVILALLFVPGYVMAFGLAFSRGLFVLLPIFGIPTVLLIIAALAFSATRLKRLPVVTTVHLLFVGALTVASLGGIMGAVWGLTYETGAYPYPDREGVEPIGAHAGPMDMYLGLALAAMVELMIAPAASQRWTKPGLAQTILGVLGAFIISLALFVGVPQIIPLSLLCYLVGFGFYFGRVGWRTFKVNPFAPGPAAAQFWGGLSFPAYVITFVLVVALYFVPGVPPPHAVLIFFAHLGFIGFATNLLLATQSTFAPKAGASPAMERAALWTLNIGFFAFMAGEFMSERREGALLMALGAIASLLVVWSRLGRSWHGPSAEGPPPPAPQAS
ncbi:MAG TPA: hypothetical protein VI818_07635 [Candidatus Thermoplasmatota archaeon]|nr:hypothetical protein [Candidatus Thermoplasmatota archaeon]